MPQTGYWPQYYTTTACTTNTYTPQIWQGWVNQSNNTVSDQWYQTTASTQQIWVNWVIQTPDVTWGSSRYATYQPVVETPEQRTARRLREEFAHKERQAARTRARALLEGFLDDEQKADLERHGRFHVTGSRGRRYCIRAEGQAGNVDLLKPDGSLQARLCCHPRQSLPDGDAWLMQMIEIRHDEDHFLRTANVHRGVLPAAA